MFPSSSLGNRMLCLLNLLVICRWSNEFLDVDLIEENDLGVCQRWKLFFVVPGWFMSYFHLLPFVNNEKYGEGENC